MLMTIDLTRPLCAPRPAVALAAAALFCTSSSAAAQSCGQAGVIDTLFEFSQRAERPQDQENESLNCPSEGTPELTVPNLPAANFPLSTADTEMKELLLYREVPGRPFPELSQDRTRLYVVCPGLLGFLDVAVEMMVLRPVSGADTVRLDVVKRVPDDPHTEERDAGEWAPVIGPQGAITFPGTDPKQARELLANLVREECLFPAAHLVLRALCTVPNPKPDTGDWLRTDKNGRPNVVGHSLGGAVTQYIAISAPPELPSKDGDSRNACREVNAYTFGSTGLATDTAGDAPSISGQLTSYASDCDDLVQKLFSGRVQPGRVFTLRSYNHEIDDIQADICRCRRFPGTQMLHDHGTPMPPPQNRELSGLATNSRNYCLPPSNEEEQSASGP